jgi:hypothetical protein
MKAELGQLRLSHTVAYSRRPRLCQPGNPMAYAADRSPAKQPGVTRRGGVWLRRALSGSYLLLVDYTGRLFRAEKATISAELAGIFDRLGSSAESWRARLEKLNLSVVSCQWSVA